MIFDMAAVINMIRPTLAKNFREYVSLQIIPFFDLMLYGILIQMRI